MATLETHGVLLHLWSCAAQCAGLCPALG